jgi:hypothetical protein
MKRSLTVALVAGCAVPRPAPWELVLRERAPRLVVATAGSTEVLLDCDGPACEPLDRAGISITVGEGVSSAFKIESVEPFAPGVVEVVASSASSYEECDEHARRHLLVGNGRKVCEWTESRGCGGWLEAAVRRDPSDPYQFALVEKRKDHDATVRPMKIPLDGDPARCAIAPAVVAYQDEHVLHERDPRVVSAADGLTGHALVLDCDSPTCVTLAESASPLGASVREFSPGVFAVTIDGERSSDRCEDHLATDVLVRDGRKVCEWTAFQSGDCEGQSFRMSTTVQPLAPGRFDLIQSDSNGDAPSILHVTLPDDGDCQIRE